MDRAQIDRLASEGTFDGLPISGHVIETHISWVIITKDNAIKIKKPVKLSFLDFSTLSLRKKYCHLELDLNRRWSDIYLYAGPIRYDGKMLAIGNGKGRVIDHCVVMKRIDENLRMDRQLRKGNVSIEQIRQLASEIAGVHMISQIIRRPFSLKHAKVLFNDIEHFVLQAGDLIDPKMLEAARRSISWSNEFLSLHEKRFRVRIKSGFQRDVHGDLHLANVFLDAKPVIFDCLEFNSRYRQIDILYEAAFLAMDLEAFGYNDLSREFIRWYMQAIPCVSSIEDQEILLYFKCLRANIRAKVHLIEASQSSSEADAKFHAGEAATYLGLMNRYITQR